MYKEIENKVLNFIRDNDLIRSEETVYVATSGGADSMALLSFLYDHKEMLEITVNAVHVNHGVRGETADRDANFVEDYCRKQAIRFTLFDASRDGKANGSTSEEWCRQLRYGYFNTLKPNHAKIATAHTMSDQAETIIFRLARGGSGLKGLTGIPAKRDRFIRPFLCLTRSEIEELVEYYGCGHITDETNLGDDYSRNKIRHYVIPELKKINDKAEEAISKSINRIAKAQDYIHSVALRELSKSRVSDKGWNYNVANFFMQDDIIIEEMLRIMLTDIGKCTEEHIETLKQYIKSCSEYNEETVLGVVELTNTIKVTVTNLFITVTNKEEESKTYKIKLNNSVYFGCFGLGVKVEEMSYSDYEALKVRTTDLCHYADADKIDLDDLIVRGKLIGDKFKPAKRVGDKVGKFMRNVPLSCRSSVPLIFDSGVGRVIWMHNVGFTDGYTPTKRTRTVYKFTSI